MTTKLSIEYYLNFVASIFIMIWLLPFIIIFVFIEHLFIKYDNMCSGWGC